MCITFNYSYIARVNGFTTYIFLLEFLAFGTLLCALLFLLIIVSNAQKLIISYVYVLHLILSHPKVDSSAQAIIVCAYIAMIFAQILSLYWYANELREQVFGK